METNERECKEYGFLFLVSRSNNLSSFVGDEEGKCIPRKGCVILSTFFCLRFEFILGSYCPFPLIRWSGFPLSLSLSLPPFSILSLTQSVCSILFRIHFSPFFLSLSFSVNPRISLPKYICVHLIEVDRKLLPHVLKDCQFTHESRSHIFRGPIISLFSLFPLFLCWIFSPLPPPPFSFLLIVDQSIGTGLQLMEGGREEG